MTDALNADRIVRRLARMKSERSPHETVWRKCFEMTYPERCDGLNGDTVDAQSAQNKKAELMDSTATDAVRLLTSSVMSGMTPANSVWFALDSGQETDDERRWLDEVAHALWENIHAANYDAAKFEAVLDSVCAGWFVLYVDDDRERGGLSFSQWPISQCFIASSKPGGRIDTVYRCFQLTAEQAVSEYGETLVARVAEFDDRHRACLERLDAKLDEHERQKALLAAKPREEVTS